MPGCIELPRPWRLLRTAAASLAEAVALPIAAYLGADALAGPPAGAVAGLAAAWLVVLIRKLACGRIPGLVMISALLLCLQALLVLVTGQAWIYLLQFPVAKLILAVLFARSAGTGDPLVARLAAEVASVRHRGVNGPGLHRFFQGNTWLWAGIFSLLAAGFTVIIATEPVTACLLICGAATAAAVCGGAAASVIWFGLVLRRHRLRLRFVPR